MSGTIIPRLRRRAGLFDPLVGELAVALEVISGTATAARANPAGRSIDPGQESLSQEDRRHAAGLMRVNHVGEVCAQALYRGQALTCRRPDTQALLLEAAREEVDHLAWCAQRLRELDSRPSFLNPLWYAGSLALGVLASRAGEAYNLGFMAETERQVEAHLDDHLKTLPGGDERSRAIVRQMRDDEIKHRKAAQKAGGLPLPAPVPFLMKMMSKVMTKSAYHI